MKVKKMIFYIIIALMVIGLFAFLITYREKILRILSPFLLSIPLVYIVKPVSDRLLEKKIPMGASVILIYLAFIAVVAITGIFFIPELASNIRELMETLPELLEQYEQIFNRLLSYIKSSNWSEQVKETIFNEIENTTEMLRKFLVAALENGLNMLLDIVRIIVDLTIAMVITYYVAKDGEKFRDYILMLLPRSLRAGIISVGKEISKILAGFIQGQLITALIVGIMETVGLMLIKMKYPLVLGMIGGIANIIPYFGPYIGAIPAVAIALTISPLKALWVVAVFLIIQQIENSFISPKMIQGKLGLHPVATIFAVLIGGEFFGIIGMLLAVPVMAIVRVLINKAVEAIV
jgi:predicted PurR-regulated permease PerM